MKQDNTTPEKNEEILSFDELKNQLNDEESTTDPEMDALLSDLREISQNMDEKAAAADHSEKAEEKEPQKEPQKDEAQEYKSIYEDVLQSVMKTEDEETTSRKNKFAMGNSQFVDVTNAYEDYGKMHDVEEKETAPELPKIEESAPTEAAAQKEYRSFNQMFKDFLAKLFPVRGDSVGEGIRKIVADVAVVALVCCFVYFGIYLVQNYQAKKQQSEITGQVIADDTEYFPESDAWTEFASKYPNVPLPEGMRMKYAYLYAMNQDLVGWVKVPKTMINIQVVQTEHHGDYIQKDFYGASSRYGTPYMDYRNDPKYLNQNTTIYGHHMSDGLVFADLKKYKSIDGFKESPVIYFDTLYKSYAFKVYAVIISNSTEEQDNGYIFNYTVPNFRSGEHFMTYIDALNERTLYKTGVDIQPDDKLLTLSTCTYEFPDARLAVIGRMVREGESEDVDTSLAEVNPNPRYPQGYYDKKGQTNPFAGAENWYY